MVLWVADEVVAVVIWGVDWAKAAATRGEVEAAGGREMMVWANTTLPEQAAAAKAAHDQLGCVDVMNNAGTSCDTTLRKTTLRPVVRLST